MCRPGELKDGRGRMLWSFAERISLSEEAAQQESRHHAKGSRDDTCHH